MTKTEAQSRKAPQNRQKVDFFPVFVDEVKASTSPQNYDINKVFFSIWKFWNWKTSEPTRNRKQLSIRTENRHTGKNSSSFSTWQTPETFSQLNSSLNVSRNFCLKWLLWFLYKFLRLPMQVAPGFPSFGAIYMF